MERIGEVERFKKDMILSTSESTPKNIVGVYFLISGEEIVYVGQSVDIIRRIKDHERTKEFDRVCWHEAPVQAGINLWDWMRSEVTSLERKYIDDFEPKYNHTPCTRCGKPTLRVYGSNKQCGNYYECRIRAGERVLRAEDAE